MSDTLHGVDLDHVAEIYGADVTYADSTIQEAGGHHLHVQGGAETMWRQVGHLTMALRELCAEIDLMRAYTCPKCGEPAASRYDASALSPFLKHVIEGAA